MHIGARWGMDGMDGMDDSFRKGSECFADQKTNFSFQLFFSSLSFIFFSFYFPPMHGSRAKAEATFCLYPMGSGEIGGEGLQSQISTSLVVETGGFRKIV